MKKKIVALILLFLVTMSSVVYADGSFVYFDSDSGRLNLCIDSSLSIGDSAVALVFEKSSNRPVFSDLFFVEHENFLQRDFDISGTASGTYTIRIGSETKDSPIVSDFVVFSESDSDVKSFIKKLKMAKDKAEFLKIIRENASLIGLRSGKYSDAAFDSAYKILADELVSLSAEKIHFVTEYFYTAQRFRSENAENVMKTDAYLLGTDYYTYSTSSVKPEIDKLLPIYDFSERITDFEEIELIAKIRSCKIADVLKNTVIDNATAIGIPASELSIYENMTETRKHMLFSEMIDKKSELKSLLDISNIFSDLLEDAKKKEDDDNNNKGGGSRSGGGGSIGSNNLSKSVAVESDYIKKISFSDTEKHWASDKIELLVQKGILNGYSDNTFRPDNYVTRAEFSKITVSAFDLEEKQSNLKFDDVKNSDWFFNPVMVLSGNGIIFGTGTGFEPNGEISRQDAAVILYRVLKRYYDTEKIENEKQFADKAEISGYAEDAVTSLCAFGIINGYSNGNFEPKAEITRAETVSMICKMLDVIGGIE